MLRLLQGARVRKHSAHNEPLSLRDGYHKTEHLGWFLMVSSSPTYLCIQYEKYQKKISTRHHTSSRYFSEVNLSCSASTCEGSKTRWCKEKKKNFEKFSPPGRRLEHLEVKWEHFCIRTMKERPLRFHKFRIIHTMVERSLETERRSERRGKWEFENFKIT